MLHYIRVWRSQCFMLLASRKYSIPLRNSLLSNISGSYLAAVSLHSHEARTGRVTRSRIQPTPPQSDTQPSSRKPMHSKVSQPAMRPGNPSVTLNGTDWYQNMSPEAAWLAILTEDFRYCNLNKTHRGRFLPHSLQFRFRCRPSIRWNACLIDVFGKAPLNSQRINH